MKIQTLVSNFAAPIRFEYLEGREFLVAPMVMITEGVHNGSKGPIYYNEEQISHPAAVATWNYKPVLVNHPNQLGSGCTPDVLNTQKVGVILNAEWDKDQKKLRAEAWLELDKLVRVDNRIIDALERGQILEVSTGVFTDNKVEGGVWNGEAYEFVAYNLRADHLALLPDTIGACSIADGAGLLQLNSKNLIHHLKQSGLINNENLSFSEIRNSLFTSLRKKFGDDLWVEEVYAENVVFERTDLDKLFVLDYTTSDEGVVLSNSEPQEVRREVKFNPVTNEREDDMSKKKLVDALVANEKTQWSEEDRDFLMKQTEKDLEKFSPIENEEDPPVDPPAAKKEETEGVTDETPKPEANSETPGKEVTVNQYIEQAPPEIREMLQEGLQTRNRQKTDMIEVIMNAEGNTYTKEQLEKKPLGDLQAISSLIPKKKEEDDLDYPAFNYSGAAGSHAGGNGHVEEPLVAPTMTWD